MVIAVFRIRITGIGSGSRILQNLLQIWDPGKKGSIVRKILKITKKAHLPFYGSRKNVIEYTDPKQSRCGSKIFDLSYLQGATKRMSLCVVSWMMMRVSLEMAM